MLVDWGAAGIEGGSSAQPWSCLGTGGALFAAQPTVQLGMVQKTTLSLSASLKCNKENNNYAFKSNG